MFITMQGVACITLHNYFKFTDSSVLFVHVLLVFSQ